MSDLNQSPKQDELSRGNDEVYHVSVPLAAVEAMCQNPYMHMLMFSRNKRHQINSALDDYEIPNEDIPNQKPPDWVIASYNCEDDKDILPIAIHTFLLDWRPDK